MNDITYTARWIFPGSAPPLPNGTITVRDERIIDVAPAGGRSADRDLGNVALLPGLVNAHTHLDLTGLRGQCPPSSDFTDWLRKVIAHRRQRTREDVEADIRAGIAECRTHGTTLIGDISALGWSWTLLAASQLRATVFHEVLGLTEVRAEAALEAAQSWLGGLASSSHLKPGLSPHAPYSVRQALFSKCAALARRSFIPCAVHLAETRDELTLLQTHAGPFRSFLQELGVWDDAGLAKSIQEVIDLCGPAIFVHGNYLSAAAVLPPGSTVVYCPRTHAAFGHSPHPIENLLKRGVRVALGTDSLASNPDLSVFAEARFLHERIPHISGAELLRMITLSGAEALGWGEETGSLTAGNFADLAMVPLENVDGSDPYELLWEHGGTRQAGAEPLVY